MDAIVSTVGTSLLTNLRQVGAEGIFSPDDLSLINRTSAGMVASPAMQALFDRADRHLAARPNLHQQTAEMTAIRKYVHKQSGLASPVLANTAQLWLATHTAMGSYCAHHLSTYVRNNYTDAQTIVYDVPDLQVNDVNTLDSGWRNLCDTLDEIHRTYDRVIYNVTGGYKLISGLVQSYATTRGSHVFYTYGPGSPLVIASVNATGMRPEISFYQDE